MSRTFTVGRKKINTFA